MHYRGPYPSLFHINIHACSDQCFHYLSITFFSGTYQRSKTIFIFRIYICPSFQQYFHDLGIPVKSCLHESRFSPLILRIRIRSDDQQCFHAVSIVLSNSNHKRCSPIFIYCIYASSIFDQF